MQIVRSAIRGEETATAYPDPEYDVGDSEFEMQDEDDSNDVNKNDCQKCCIYRTRLKRLRNRIFKLKRKNNELQQIIDTKKQVSIHSEAYV